MEKLRGPYSAAKIAVLCQVGEVNVTSSCPGSSALYGQVRHETLYHHVRILKT